MEFMNIVKEQFRMLSPKHILIVVSALDMFSAGLLMPQLANHMHTLGGSHIVIGVMGALYSASQLISGPLIGSLSDLRGRKPILLLCLSICGLSYLSLGFITSVFIFLVVRVILGLTKQTQLLSKALGPDYVKGAEQSVLYGRMASVSGIGMSVGPIIGGHIMEALPEKGFTVITIIMAGIFALNKALIQSLPEVEEKKTKDKKEVPSIAPKLIDSIKTPLKESIDEFYKIDWTVFGDVFLYKLLMTLCMMMYFGNFGLFLRTVHSVSPKNLGYIISLQGVTGSLCTYFIGYINKLYKTDTDFSLRNFHIFFTITLTLIGLAVAPNLSIFIALLMPLAIASSIGRVVTLEMITGRSKSDNRGTVIGASNSVKSLSGVFTPLIAGIINQYLGSVYVFLMAASFTGIGSVVSYRIRLKSLEAKDK